MPSGTKRVTSESMNKANGTNGKKRSSALMRVASTLSTNASVGSSLEDFIAKANATLESVDGWALSSEQKAKEAAKEAKRNAERAEQALSDERKIAAAQVSKAKDEAAAEIEALTARLAEAERKAEVAVRTSKVSAAAVTPVAVPKNAQKRKPIAVYVAGAALAAAGFVFLGTQLGGGTTSVEAHKAAAPMPDRRAKNVALPGPTVSPIKPSAETPTPSVAPTPAPTVTQPPKPQTAEEAKPDKRPTALTAAKPSTPTVTPAPSPTRQLKTKTKAKKEQPQPQPVVKSGIVDPFATPAKATKTTPKPKRAKRTRKPKASKPAKRKKKKSGGIVDPFAM